MMRFCRKTIGLLVLSVLSVLPLKAAPPELVKHVPGEGMFYGEAALDVLRKAPLYQQLSRKYPKLQTLLNQKMLNGTSADMQSAVFTMPADSHSFAVLLYFSAPFRADAIAQALKKQGLAHLYEEKQIAGYPAYVVTEETGGGHTCFVLIGERIMFCCMEDAAAELLTGKKLSPELSRKLSSDMGKNIFFRLFPGVIDADSAASDYQAEAGWIRDGGTLSAAFRVQFRDEIKARNVENQIRQWMLIGSGILFADDGDLGMALVQRIRVTRKGGLVSVKAELPAALIERLADYGIRQAEKREQQAAELLRKRESRRQQSLKSDSKAPVFPAGKKR